MKMTVDLVRNGGVFALAVALLLLPDPSWAAQCRDNDRDTFGVNCAHSLDCNDNDPTINLLAGEICDGKDNDCNSNTPDGILEANKSCGTGLLGVCAAGTTQCSGGSLQCVATASPSAESCNALDDDCNGIVDDVPGPDADQDGASDACDCAPNDAARAPGMRDLCGDGIDQDCDLDPDNLLTDAQGRRYCFEMDDIVASPGQTATVALRAFHEDGIRSISLVEEGGAGQVFECGSVQTCTIAAPVGDYAAPRHLSAGLTKVSGGSSAEAARLTRVAEFVCQRDHCEPDPQLRDFTSWMRGKGYAECVSSRHLGYSLDLAERTSLTERNIQKDFLEKRGSPGLTQPYVVNVYDVVPTDSGATSITIGPGEGGNCQKSPYWAAFCPSAEPADFLFLERHFERTFGLDFDFEYQPPLQVNYVEEFGPPTLNGNEYVFTVPLSFYNQHSFPLHSIVHFSMQTFNGNPIAFFGNSAGGVANTTAEPAVGEGGNGAGTFTHEWGHTWGLQHTFVAGGLAIPYPDYVFMAMDGVMSNGYRQDTYLADQTDPLERYALEPLQGPGFTDDATFASAFSSGSVGSPPLPTCGTVDPAIADGRYVGLEADNHIFEVTLANNGTAPVGYVRLHANDSGVPGYFYADRVIHVLEPAMPITHRVSIPSFNLLSNAVVFKLDPLGQIAESDETNNTRTVSRPLPACVDGDGDGYPQNCVGCEHPSCPTTDCHDGEASVHPGAVEGPPGSPTCLDGFDNDCDSQVDGWDEASCSFTRKAVADHQTGPGRIIQGSYLSTQTSNDQREGLEETVTQNQSRLVHTWRFENVPNTPTYELLLEGNRPNNAEGDNFQFYVSTNGSTFTAVSGAVIDRVLEPVGGGAFPFTVGSHAGTLYVRVQDTHAKKGSTALDRVFVDYLAIRAVP